MTANARRARRTGFTLVEVIVALAVLLILAAVAIPQIGGYVDQKRIESTASQLVIVRDALYLTGTGFRQVIQANASELSHLSSPITAADDDSCGNAFSTAERNRWPNGGPFVNFVIDATSGMATPIGLANNALVRAPTTATTGVTNRLRITWTNASLADAEALDLYVDGAAGWNAGTVQWTPQAGTNGVVTTLYYDIVIDATC
jgi:prepilin-type N-terminal cleavage/methylation domain-containing protein